VDVVVRSFAPEVIMVVAATIPPFSVVVAPKAPVVEMFAVVVLDCSVFQFTQDPSESQEMRPSMTIRSSSVVIESLSKKTFYDNYKLFL